MAPRQRPLGPWDSRAPVRRSRHGLSPNEIDALLRAQRGVCAICGTRDPGQVSWSVDHDHALALTHPHNLNFGCRYCVRGLLCESCNSMLGRARDNSAVLRAGADYLDLRRPRTPDDRSRGLSGPRVTSGGTFEPVDVS
jgi:hypothetical protein